MAQFNITQIKYKNSAAKGDWNNLAVDLNWTGHQLREKLSELCNLPPDGMKILHKGKFLKDEELLSNQGFVKGSQVLVMKGKTQQEVQTQKEKFVEQQIDDKKTDLILEAAKKIADRVDDGENNINYYFEVENQSGSGMQLDPEDRKAIIVAMTLHEKGTKELNIADYQKALKFFLEADKNFTSVKDKQLLDNVDNVGRLCLDIAWTYFKLKNIQYLQDAYWRLNKAEESFKKAYGDNNERLIQLKGGSCPELVMFVRLYLLQAIVIFHTGDVERSFILFQKAEEKLNAMTFSDDEISQLLSMGFSTRECRIALRACSKNITNAAQWILSRREKLQEKKEAERIENERKRRMKSYGKTSDNKPIDLDLVDKIISMGFEEKMVVQAVRQCNNDELNTITILTTNPEVLFPKKLDYEVKDEDINSLVTMGFTKSLASGTLKKTQNFQKALDLLLNGLGVEDTEVDKMEDSDDKNENNNNDNVDDNNNDVNMEDNNDNKVADDNNENNDNNEDNNDNSDDNKDEDTDMDNNNDNNNNLVPSTPFTLPPPDEKRLAEREILDTIGYDDEIAYLDIDLTEEKNVLTEYYTLIQNWQTQSQNN